MTTARSLRRMEPEPRRLRVEARARRPRSRERGWRAAGASGRRAADNSARATRPAGPRASRAADATVRSARARRCWARSTGTLGPGTRPAAQRAASPARPVAERRSRPRGGDAEVPAQELEIERLLPHAQVVIEQGEHAARERIEE